MLLVTTADGDGTHVTLQDTGVPDEVSHCVTEELGRIPLSNRARGHSIETEVRVALIDPPWFPQFPTCRWDIPDAPRPCKALGWHEDYSKQFVIDR